MKTFRVSLSIVRSEWPLLPFPIEGWGAEFTATVPSAAAFARLIQAAGIEAQTPTPALTRLVRQHAIEVAPQPGQEPGVLFAAPNLGSPWTALPVATQATR